MNHTAIGNNGEELACKYLINKGYKIIRRNFHFGRYGEIDIISEFNNTLIFIEVKYRKSLTFGSPVCAISVAKQKSLRKSAEGYLYVNKITDKDCRFDLIAIDASSGTPKIEHIENAM